MDGRELGWISLYRMFTEWGWYKDQNVKSLFLHCLLKANFKDKPWKGITIKRGQFVTSINTLCKELGLSYQQVRTALDKLSATKEITCESTNKYTLITVIKYSDYQSAERFTNKVVNMLGNNQPTINQQSSNNQITTTNNVNNSNNSLLAATERQFGYDDYDLEELERFAFNVRLQQTLDTDS